MTLLRTTCALFAAVSLLKGCGPEAKPPAPPPPPKILYVNPTKQVVTEFEEFTGRTAPVKLIELRSRVSGTLINRNFVDGEEVKQDQLLFEIDPLPFEAEELRTRANLDQNEARYQRLDRQYQRFSELMQSKAITQDEFEQSKFDRAEAIAAREAARAAHQIAKLNLSYTKITAPIGGKISRRLVDQGNLVTADVTLLSTIVPLDSVHVYFDMDERTVLRLRRMDRPGDMGGTAAEPTQVTISLADAAEYALPGTIDFQENQIDPTTGTLRIRAIVENPKRLLSPGMFVRVRYPIGQPESSLLIPEESLGSDQGQPFVYVIGPDNKVAYRKLTLGTQLGKMRVVREGLLPEDRIAVTGLQKIRREMEVAPELQASSTTEQAPASKTASTRK